MVLPTRPDTLIQYSCMNRNRHPYSTADRQKSLQSYNLCLHQPSFTILQPTDSHTKHSQRDQKYLHSHRAKPKSVLHSRQNEAETLGDCRGNQHTTAVVYDQGVYVKVWVPTHTVLDAFDSSCEGHKQARTTPYE